MVCLLIGRLTDCAQEHQSNELERELNDFASELVALSTMLEQAEACGDPLATRDNRMPFSAEVAEADPQPPTAVACAAAPASRSAITARSRRKSLTRQPYALRTTSRRRTGAVRTAKSPIATQERVAFWQNFQRKNISLHVSRQQQARLRAYQAQAAQQRLVAARYQMSSTISRNQGKKFRPSHQQPPKGTRNDDESYLERFNRDRQGLRHEDSPSEPNDHAERLLCGVYLYGRRHDSLVYTTFASLEQLHTRARAQLDIRQVLHIYRERAVFSVSQRVAAGDGSQRHRRRVVPLLQRIERFDQVADGDTLCVTQNAYEDMAILCEWLSLRRQQPGTARGGHNDGAELANASQHRFGQHTRSPNAVPALRHMVKAAAARRNRPVMSDERAIPPMWDCNGRSIRVGGVDYFLNCTSEEDTQTNTKL